jgi:hypothetical protein
MNLLTFSETEKDTNLIIEKMENQNDKTLRNILWGKGIY